MGITNVAYVAGGLPALQRAGAARGENMTMHGMMPTEMMWGMGAVGLLVIIVLVLAAIALAKYVFAGRMNGGQR